MVAEQLLLAAIAFFVLASGQDRAEVDIKVAGACSPVYLERKGIDINKYQPAIRFNPDKVKLVPKSPIIPGCIKIQAEGVEITKPVKNLVAEIEMRIGGSPDPRNPTLPCNKKIDNKVNQCPCAKLENTCVFCDFCRQLKSQTQTHIKASRRLPNGRKNIDDDCKCEELQPGLYDIETEMCTPEIDDAKDYIPPEIQNNILDKRPISMFITVYLMDLEQRGTRESYLSAFGKKNGSIDSSLLPYGRRRQVGLSISESLILLCVALSTGCVCTLRRDE